MSISRQIGAAGTILAVLFGHCADPALAAQAVGQFNVTATVLTNCVVSASDLAFGDYNASLGTPTLANTTISVTCTNGLAYTVALDGGTTSHSVTARTMTDGSANSLAYELYTSGAFSSIWGDGTGGSVTVSGNGDGSAQALTVYGRIGAAQFVPAGSYSDRISVTVNY